MTDAIAQPPSASRPAAGSVERALDRRGPLAERYAPAVALVLLALTPYLALTTAYPAVESLIGADLGITTRGLSLASGMANAAYSFGAVLAVQLASKLPSRRLLVVYAVLFVLGTVLAAWAPVPGFFFAGHVIQGLATGLMLIGAVPPLITRFGLDKLPKTAVVMNLGLFGAIALGPVIGGAAAGADDWRVMFWIVGGLGLGALAFALLTYEDQPPDDPEAPWDVIALTLSALGCALLFFGVAELNDRRAYELLVLGPVLAGLALIVILLVHQYKSEDPLIPVRKLVHTIPVAAIIAAMAAGSASVVLSQLAQQALTLRGVSPNHAGMLFWPEFGAAFVAALIFGRVLLKGYAPALAFGGLLLLGGAAAILSGAASGPDSLVLVGSGVAGFGVGSCVAPAMFSAGFSMPQRDLPRVFAIVELLRGVAAFLVAPAVLILTETATTSPAVGLRTGMWIAMGIALGGAIVAGAIYLLGRPGLPKPDPEPWFEGEDTAVHSPPLFARLRGGSNDGSR